jgi:hypothetical protein
VCALCDEIDVRIARYRELAKHVSDKAALESIDRLTADLEAKKLSLHSMQENHCG